MARIGVNVGIQTSSIFAEQNLSGLQPHIWQFGTRDDSAIVYRHLRPWTATLVPPPSSAGFSLSNQSSLVPATLNVTGGPDPSTTVLGRIGAGCKQGYEWVTARLQLVAINEIHNNHRLGTSIPMARNTFFAPMLHVEIRKPELDTNDPSREWHTGPRRRWVTVGTALEIGAGIQGTMPVGYGFSVSGAVGFKGVVEVDCTLPVELGFESTKEATQKLGGRSVSFPFSAKEAMEIKTGAEYEVRGRGSIFCRGGVIGGGAIGYGPLSAKAGLAFDASGTYTGELALRIKKLGKVARDAESAQSAMREHDDQKPCELIQMSVRRTEGSVARLSAALQVNLELSDGAAIPTNGLPSVGQGVLKIACQTQGPSSPEGFVAKYMAVRAQAALTYSESTNDEHALLFKVGHNKLADEAFQKALHLDFTLAYRLAEANRINPQLDTGVLHASHTARACGQDVDAEVIVLGQRLLAYQHHDLWKNGKLVDHEGNVMLYVVNTSQRHYEDVLAGSEDISWRTLLIRRGDGSYEPMLEFEYNAIDPRTFSHEVMTILTLAEIAGDPKATQYIEEMHDTIENLDDFTPWQRSISDEDDTIRRAKVRFQPKGIQKMLNANRDTCIDAFMKAAIIRDTDIDGTMAYCPKDIVRQSEAREFLKKYNKAMNHSCFNCLSSAKDHAIIDNAASFFTERGEDITKIAPIYGAAEEFSNTVMKLQKIFLNTTNERDRAKRMADTMGDLGAAHGFNFAGILGAMMILCGADDTHVEELSIKGKTLAFNMSEGVLDEPMTIIDKAMNASQWLPIEKANKAAEELVRQQGPILSGVA